MKRNIPTYSDGNISLRLLEKVDLSLTLSWRNDPENRKWFKGSEEIDLSSHLAWYSNYKTKTDDFMFIAYQSTGGVFGQLAIYNVKDGSAEIGRFVVDLASKGKGKMRASIMLLLQVAKEEFAISTLSLEVFDSNIIAIKLYKSLGFKELSNSNHLVKMALTI